jgi:hypothetical protein
MASKRKPNGCTSVRKVEEAIKKVGSPDLLVFFWKAAQTAKEQPGAVVVAREARRFGVFLEKGVAEFREYRLPDWALRFAEIVHGHRCPLNFFKSLPPPPEPESVTEETAPELALVA